MKGEVKKQNSICGRLIANVSQAHRQLHSLSFVLSVFSSFSLGVMIVVALREIETIEIANRSFQITHFSFAL